MYTEWSELCPEEHLTNIVFSNQQHSYADQDPVTDTLFCQAPKKIPGKD